MQGPWAYTRLNRSWRGLCKRAAGIDPRYYENCHCPLDYTFHSFPLSGSPHLRSKRSYLPGRPPEMMSPGFTPHT
jgi:hypothetical protein